MKTLITLTKISELEDAKHPHNILEGHVVRGWLIKEPEVGSRFYVNGFWSTSTVKEIIDGDTFKTLNSLYKIERSLVADDCNVFGWITNSKKE